MDIHICCTIDEEQLREGLQTFNITREEFQKRINQHLSEDIFETLSDNKDLFSKVVWSIDNLTNDQGDM